MLRGMPMYPGDFCCEPQHRILSSIRTEFGSKWKHIGYALGIEHGVLENIEIDYRRTGDQTFRMLNEWMQRDADSCYCKLISAMNKEGLVRGVQILKASIKSGIFCMNKVCM